MDRQQRYRERERAKLALTDNPKPEPIEDWVTWIFQEGQQHRYASHKVSVAFPPGHSEYRKEVEAAIQMPFKPNILEQVSEIITVVVQDCEKDTAQQAEQVLQHQ